MKKKTIQKKTARKKITQKKVVKEMILKKNDSFSKVKNHSKRKHLVITTDSFFPRWDGITRFLYEIIPYLKKKYKITIIAPDFKTSLDFPINFKNQSPVSLVKVPLGRIKIGDYTPAKFYYKTIMKQVADADIVWSQILGPIGTIGLIAANYYDVPSYLYVNSIESDLYDLVVNKFKRVMGKINLTIMSYFYNNVTQLIVPHKKILSLLKFKIKSPVVEIPLGVNIKKFKPIKSYKKIRSELGIPQDSFVIGYAGRIAREKNLMLLYRAFLKIHNLFPQARLLIVGNGIEYNYFESNPLVYKFGETNEIEKYYHAMDCFVLPSNTETSSLTVFEAMSSGLPVIATKVGMVPTYISHGDNGFLIPKNNLNQLVLSLHKLISDNLLCDLLGNAARNTVINDFSWEKTAEKLIDLFEKN